MACLDSNPTAPSGETWDLPKRKRNRRGGEDTTLGPRLSVLDAELERQQPRTRRKRVKYRRHSCTDSHSARYVGRLSISAWDGSQEARLRFVSILLGAQVSIC